MTTFLVAAIQMDTTSNQDQNLSVAADFIGEAAKKGAKLIALPETMAYLGRDYAALSEAVPGGKTATYLSALPENMASISRVGVFTKEMKTIRSALIIRPSF